MTQPPLTFHSVSTESLPPDESRAGDIFSRLGYRFHDAIADLVDNSLDAEATCVLIRFVRSADGIQSVLIVDNGIGMSDVMLREAMRFGSRIQKGPHQLGKYGIGLKSASLSQAETVTVLTRERKSSFAGRRWTLENVKSGWTCEVLSKDAVSAWFKSAPKAAKIKESGTAVVWERLEHLRALPNTIDKVLQMTRTNLCIELGIRFHRFLAAGDLSICIDEHFAGEPDAGHAIPVLPLDPFSYERPGDTGYPLKLKMNLGDVTLAAECHIWPPKSRSPGYRLGGGKVASRQGFYFYRNGRVIQAGGWNGMRADDGEPHLSLARVKIDLPGSLDSVFKLDVTKSQLDPSPKFVNALQSASYREVTFASYLDKAISVYRKQKTKEGGHFPFVPSSGLTEKARKAIGAILAEKGTGQARKVSLRWAPLDHDEIFRLEAGSRSVLLNSKFKRDLAEGDRRDAPVLKILLLFLLQPELDKAFSTQKAQARLQKINHALIASLKHG